VFCSLSQVTLVTMAQICKAFTQSNICCTNTACQDGVCKMHSKKTYDECSICYDNMFVKETLACGHSFCKHCIYKWKGNTCPLCRSIMFYVNHKKESLIDVAQHNISIIDEQLRTNTLNEECFELVMNFFAQNMWLYYYDMSYLDILFEYTTYSLKNRLKHCNRHFKIMKAISANLGN
jgi:hypothetical protein